MTQNSNSALKAAIEVQYFCDENIIEGLKDKAARVVEDFKTRANVEGQFLNWVDLPKKQLERLNEIDSYVSEMKKQNGDKPLAVLGIGGSKHTLEHLLNLSGFHGKVKFYSDIDPMSYNKFKDEAGMLNSLNFLVVSKSGTTFETKDAYLRVEKELFEIYKDQDKVNKHFMAVTDKSDKSELRQASNAKNYVGKMFVHDDVGGRYSALDDHGIFTLLYAGMEKDDVAQILKGAIEMSEASLNVDSDINVAMKRAMFYVGASKTGINESVQQLFGRIFESGTENWLKQLHFESLKDSRLSVGKAPDSMHYAAESHFDPRNKFDATLTVLAAGDCPCWNNYKGYLEGIISTYQKVAPTSVEKLEINKNGVTPRALGAYTQMKHFETVFKGMLRREANNESQPSVLDEVLQPSVEVYKKNLKGRLAPGE